MSHPRSLRLAACVAGIATVILGCEPIVPTTPTPSAGAALPAGQPANGPVAKWPAPSDPIARTTAAGLAAETAERLAFHVHAHLDLFIDGAPVVVPAGIGINITDPGVTEFDLPDGTKSYGGIKGCGQPCISPLHTHAETGVIHTESATPTPNTLGQFFTEWGVPLSATCVGEYCAPQTVIAIYLNGTPFTGDPTAIQLSNLLEIAVVIGTPPPVIPATADFSQP